MILFLDTETRGRRFEDGVYVYSTLGEAEIILIAWAIDDGPVQVREFDKHHVASLLEYPSRVHTIVMHNAEFDCTMLAASDLDIYIPLCMVHCTMAQARMHGLPGGLAKLCELYKLSEDVAKQKTGKRLMNLFCKPNKEGTFNDKTTHPVEWEAFKDYAKHDVTAMRELYYRMPQWNCTVERPIWEADQEMNGRGIRVDLEFASSVVSVLKGVKLAADQEFAARTADQVTSGTQRDRLLSHILIEHGVALPDLTASTLERRVEDPDLPDEVRELLELRLQTAKTSTAKYAALLRSTCSDGRARGGSVYCGASRTGRWSGRIFQHHNQPRPTLVPAAIEAAIETFKLLGRHPGSEALASSLLPDLSLHQYASQCVRGVITAAPGYRLLVADYSNIEGRIAAWCAGEAWKLAAFEAFDKGKGPDLYKVSYANCAGISIQEVSKLQRQIGKVFELMLQYGGAVAAFVTGAAGYHIDLIEMTRAVKPTLPPEVWKRALSAHAWHLEQKNRLAKELGEEVWSVCWALTRLWRAQNPRIEALWHELEHAVELVLRTDHPRDVGRVRIEREGNWVRIVLPSGRALCYPSMRADTLGLSYIGVNRYTHRWERIRTWGGTLLENICQAIARDILAAGMMDCIRLDGHPIFHVHDELVLEEEIDSGWSVSLLERCLTHFTGSAKTYAGLPLAAVGFETPRYYKEV